MRVAIPLTLLLDSWSTLLSTRVREGLLHRLAAAYDQGVPDSEGGCI